MYIHSHFFESHDRRFFGANAFERGCWVVGWLRMKAAHLGIAPGRVIASLGYLRGEPTVGIPANTTAALQKIRP